MVLLECPDFPPFFLTISLSFRNRLRLDVNDIKVVINYDYPNNSEDYVHRIGRTGRRDKTVCSILTASECMRQL